MDQKALMKEVSRVLKPGGVIVFSDIMQGDGGGDCTSFTGQNVVASMASPQMYKVCTHHMHCPASRHRRAHAYLHCMNTPSMIDRGRYGEHYCRHSAPLRSLSLYLIPHLASSVDLVTALGANSTDDVLSPVTSYSGVNREIAWYTRRDFPIKATQKKIVQDAMTGAGMTIVEHKELTSHLTPYFKCMLDAVKDGKETMLKQGVTQERLDAYEDDLSTRFERVKQGHFAWDMFCAKN